LKPVSLSLEKRNRHPCDSQSDSEVDMPDWLESTDIPYIDPLSHRFPQDIGDTHRAIVFGRFLPAHRFPRRPWSLSGRGSSLLDTFHFCYVFIF
jgi:hypothetical protein